MALAFCSYMGRALNASFMMSSFLASNCSSAMHSSKNFLRFFTSVSTAMSMWTPLSFKALSNLFRASSASLSLCSVFNLLFLSSFHFNSLTSFSRATCSKFCWREMAASAICFFSSSSCLAASICSLSLKEATSFSFSNSFLFSSSESMSSFSEAVVFANFSFSSSSSLACFSFSCSSASTFCLCCSIICRLASKLCVLMLRESLSSCTLDMVAKVFWSSSLVISFSVLRFMAASSMALFSASSLAAKASSSAFFSFSWTRADASSLSLSIVSFIS